MRLRLLLTAILLAGAAGAEFAEVLVPEEADEAYENVYRIAERHQKKAVLLLIKSKLRCDDLKNPSANCRKVINEFHELLMRLNAQLGDQEPSVKTLRDYYCDMSDSQMEEDDERERKRCKRMTRLQNNLELSPEEQLSKVLKIEK